MADNQLGFREMYMSQSVPVITTGARNAAYLTNTRLASLTVTSRLLSILALMP